MMPVNTEELMRLRTEIAKNNDRFNFNRMVRFVQAFGIDVYRDESDPQMTTHFSSTPVGKLDVVLSEHEFPMLIKFAHHLLQAVYDGRYRVRMEQEHKPNQIGRAHV